LIHETHHRWFALASLGILALALALSLAGLVRAQEGDASALDPELEALLREIRRGEPAPPPDREGEAHFALVIATSELRGEVAPCG